ncbi:MAG TPA: TMEM165/GDT1 family protein [Burkholderiales bacterium]
MEALLVSTAIVALAEMGDKTQLLSLVLAARYRRPWTIVLGILLATLANHALAAGVGAWITRVVEPTVLRWIVGLGFIAMAVWTLIPDKLDSGEHKGYFGVLGTTCVAFFLAEMGDKTQVATVGLAARYATFAPVVMGTTLGMLIANIPAVLLGEKLSKKVPLRALQRLAAVMFAILGVMAIVFT